MLACMQGITAGGFFFFFYTKTSQECSNNGTARNVRQFHRATGFSISAPGTPQEAIFWCERVPIFGLGDDFSSLCPLKGQFYFVKRRYQMRMCLWGYQGEFYLLRYIHYFVKSHFIITRLECIGIWLYYTSNSFNLSSIVNEVMHHLRPWNSCF